jgi:hypothetical protein
VRALTLISVFLSVSLASGCFAYVPLQEGPPDPDPGTALRAELTERGQERLRPVTGSFASRTDGTLVSSTPDSLVLAVEFRGYSASRDGGRLTSNVAIPRDEIAELSLRKLSVPRTGFLIAAGTAAVFLLLRAIDASGQPEGPGPSPPGF